MDVKPTPHDKGLSLTLRVTAYDNGMVQVDGVPINAAPDYDAGHGWLGAAETVLLTLSEFRRQAETRRRQRVGLTFITIMEFNRARGADLEVCFV
jgi:hypothetical protein